MVASRQAAADASASSCHGVQNGGQSATISSTFVQGGHHGSSYCVAAGRLLAARGVAVSGGSAWAQQKLVLKATDVHPLGYPTVEAVVRMGKKLESREQRQAQHPDVSVDAARRREGNDRAGAGRRACDGPHQRRPDGTAGAGAQRLQPAVHVPRCRAYGEGDRRPNRRRDAQEAERPSDRRADRSVLDECRHPQRLQQQASDEVGRATSKV